MTKKQLFIGVLTALCAINGTFAQTVQQEPTERVFCSFNDNGFLTKISNRTVGLKMAYLAVLHPIISGKLLVKGAYQYINDAIQFKLKDPQGNNVHGARNYAHWIGHYLGIKPLLRGNYLNSDVVTACAKSHVLQQDGYDLIKSIKDHGIECSVATSHDELTFVRLKRFHWSDLKIDLDDVVYPSAELAPRSLDYFIRVFMRQFQRGATKVIHIETSKSRINYALKAQKILCDQGLDVVVIKYNIDSETIERIKRELGLV